ncbi:uncharacterized protein RSE6_03624 [Rhynchosporium secalis]|uniref:Uncharacterized protein n=1 Tax=Rhynchosporium secalis TaxID=38038 RepID=A0A1E1M379_RHYSE|nr:uncharacterized protein RSE6_03624 [Rhynchosporium secalis]
MLFYKFSTRSEVRNGLRVCYRPRYDPWSYISYTQYGGANQICLRRSKYVPELSLDKLSNYLMTLTNCFYDVPQHSRSFEN